MNDDITILADFDSALYEQVEPPLVSLYLPTHGSAPGDESDRIEFEALVEQARAKLAQERERREYKGVDERLAYAAEHFDDLMSPAPGGSLAVLAGNDRTYIYRLGYEAGPLAFVGERFYVKPLLKNSQFGSHYFLLGLSADRFAFVHGDFGSLERVELPRDVLDAFSEEFPLVYDGHEGALDYSSLENHMPPYHGWKSRNDVRKEEAGKFFQYVNKAVTDYLVAGTDLPVILVSLPEHQSAFRRISTIPHLLDEGIEKDIGGIEAPELLADAKAVIEHVREARATELLEKFGDAEAHGGASSDLKAIGLALVERKVRALFLAEGAYIPGGFDEQTGEVFLFEREPHGRFQGPELADGFVRAALAQDADVFELPAEKIPGDSGIAALYRY